MEDMDVFVWDVSFGMIVDTLDGGPKARSFANT